MSERPPKNQTELLRDIVKACGGVWVGVQETVPPLPHLLMFNSPQTDSTLAVKLEPGLTFAEIAKAVKKRIADSDKTFKRISK